MTQKLAFGGGNMRRTFKVSGGDMEFTVTPLGVFLKDRTDTWNPKVYSMSIADLIAAVKAA